MRWGHGLILLLCTLTAWALDDFDRKLIERRIAPIGKVRVLEVDGEQKTVNAVSQKAAAPKALAPGQAVYQKYCIICHANGLAGAPKFRNKADWEPRLKAKKMAGLVQSAVNGLNAMPPKGTCIDCTEDDFKEAINYMLAQ